MSAVPMEVEQALAELAARDARAREAFLQIDTNGDGYVDPAEFVAWLNSLNWHRDLPTEQARLEAMERYFRLVDVNVTNRLDHYDFCRLFGLLDDHHKAQTAYTSRAETAFRRFDTNCSGTIDRLEFRQVLIGLGCGAALYAPAGSPENVDSIFYRLDADRDGTLSLAEFTAFYVQAEQEATKTAKQGGAALELFQRLSGGQLFITKVQFWEASLELGLFEGLSHEQAVAKVNEEFPLADLDNSGTLNFDEFARYYRVMDGLRIKREHGVKDMDMF